MLAKKLKITFFFLLSFCSTYLTADSQHSSKVLTLDADQFLSNSFVRDITQDSEGFLWFATQNGVNKYNGKSTKFYNYDSTVKDSIASNWIDALLVDSKGRLWVVSDKGFHLYSADIDGFLNFQTENSAPFISIKESKNGTIWALSKFGHLAYIKDRRAKPSIVTLKRIDNNDYTYEDFETIDDEVYLLTDHGQIHRLNDAQGNISLAKSLDIDKTHLTSTIQKDFNSNLWIATLGSGLYKYSAKSNKLVHYKLCSNTIYDILFTNEETTWIATDKGVCALELIEDEINVTTEHLFNSPVKSIYKDSADNIWAGTFNGVFYWSVSDKSFITYNAQNIPWLQNENILAFTKSEKGNLYISSWGQGITSTRHEILAPPPQKIELFLKDTRLKNTVSMYTAPDNTIWFGTYRNGLFKTEADSSITHIPGTESKGISSILQIDQEHVVASIVGEGLSFISNSGKRKLELNPKFGKYILAIKKDNNTLWSASYDKGIVYSHINKSEISLNQTTQVKELNTSLDIEATALVISDQYIWAGTKDHGLLRIEKDSVYQSDTPELKFYNKRDGLASDFIYGILEDDYGNIWFNHDKGISRLDPTTDKVINFNETHGLQGTDFNSSAYYKDKHGRLYFGGANGFNAFTPDEVPINRHKPPLRLTKFSESNEEMPIHSKLREDGYLELKHNETILDFEFAALDFTRPQDNQYQYMMEGLTDKWVSLGTNNHLSFSHLPVGDYTLRVKGSNNDGVWSDELTIPIEVLPPIWRTWYAYLFYLTLVIGAIVLLIIQQREKLRAQLANEQRLHKLAYYDSLTGLPNRQSFYETLEKFLSLAKREHYRAGIVFIDLDRFKRINDTLGHDYGDKVLKEVAFRLQESVRESDMVVTSAEINQFDTELARLGGDEFTLFLSRLDSADEATMITQRIIDAVSEPIKLDEYEVSVTPSVGIAIYPENGETVSELMKHADIAIYQAKAEGRRTFKFYSDSLNEKALERLKLETELKGAIAAGQFELHYQPQVDIHNNQISKAEALVRWHHPELGMVSPAVFIPMAEESGLIIELGDWILEQACKDAKMWQEQLPNPCRVSVNVSSIQFKQSALVDKIENVLSSTGLPANLLEIELTESAIMSDVEDNILRLQQIKNMGVAIACDDFGTGYSSLSYLKRFPLDTLKIDRSFIQDVTTDENDLVIVKAVMLLADTMNLKVVAEGVESIEQLEILHKYQCEYIQGYYFAKPLPLDDFILFVTKEFYEDKFMWELELLNSAPRLNS